MVRIIVRLGRVKQALQLAYRLESSQFSQKCQTTSYTIIY